MPAIGAIYSAADVLVSGVVKGRVTVASAATSSRRQLTYNANGADVLGLEAQGTIYIAQWAMSGSTLNSLAPRSSR